MPFSHGQSWGHWKQLEMDRTCCHLPAWNPLPPGFISSPAWSCTPQVENSWGTAKCHSNIQGECRKHLCFIGSPSGLQKGMYRQAAAKASGMLGGQGIKKLQLLPEITNSDTEMPRNKVLFPPPTFPYSAGIHFTNLCCWLGVSSLASAFRFPLNNGNIATESSECWLREWLSERDGWACKRKCASNADCYEVMGLGAIDQSEKSILNGKIMQHASKGKDLGTIPKSCNPSLGMQLNRKKKMKIKVCWETGDRNAFREQNTNHTRMMLLSRLAAGPSGGQTPFVSGSERSLSQQQQHSGQHKGRDTADTCHVLRYPQHKHSTHISSYRFAFSSQFCQHLKQLWFHPEQRK